MIRKRLLSACLALALCLGLLPVTALAAGEHDSHSNGWTELTADTTTLSGGCYYLSGGVEYTGAKSITVSGEVILCLNGHKLDLKGQHISVGSGASLTLCDCSTGGVLTGGSGSKGGGVYVGGGGTFTMTGGSIAGNTAESGGGVYVDEGGTFTMEDGSINNNQVTSGGGGGVMVNKGSFTLSGGSITGNATSDATYGYGGGVCLYGTFNLSGDAIIQNNTKAGATDNLYLGWNTINITGPLGENAHIGVTAEGVPRSFISGWSNNMVGKNPADYFSSDGDACGIGLNANGDVVLGSLCTTITLNPNGGTLPEYSLVAGAALPIPTKTGYTFDGWYENPDFSGNPVADVPTDSTGELTFYAKWTVNIYTITANASPAEGGSVTVNGSTSPVSVTAGTEVTLSATANSGYCFVGWVDQSGQSVSSDNPYTFAANSSHTLNAKFERLYTVTVGSTAGGTATGGGTYTEGDTVTLTATPNAGYRFTGWTSSDGVTFANASSESTTFTMPAGDVTVRAVFSPVVNIPDTHEIELIVGDGGEAKLSLTNASAGSTITVTATPDEGYELAYITVDGERISGTTFKMPDHDVTVRVYFTDGSATLPFTDVSAGAWYLDAVSYVYANGLMDGTSGTTFEPDANMTRAMVWAILARVDGETVTGTNWIETAREWAMAEGVSDGENASGYVTREQLATMLYRYAVYKGYDVSIGEDTNILSYADFADLSEYAIPAMQWACGAGIVNGTSESTLAPQGEATRAQVAAMLMRFVEAIG